MTHTRNDVAPVDAAELVVILTTAGLVFLLYAMLFFVSLAGIPGWIVPFAWVWAGPLLAIAGIVALGAAVTIRGVSKPTLMRI